MVVLHGLLFLLPALALAAPLLARRYPGERIVLALRAERPRSRRLRPGAVACPRSRRPVAVSGGRLIGCSLAVRPPPAALLAS